jgi:hypothetical protein
MRVRVAECVNWEVFNLEDRSRWSEQVRETPASFRCFNRCRILHCEVPFYFMVGEREGGGRNNGRNGSLKVHSGHVGAERWAES